MLKKLPLLFCFLTSITSFSQKSAYLNELSTKWKNGTEYTQKVMDLMPQKEYGFIPSKDEMSFEEQLMHISKNICWLSSKLLNGGIAPHTDFGIAGKSRKEVIKIINDCLAFGQNTIDNFDESKLDELVEFNTGQKTKRQILNLIHDHHTHHRGQLLVYLRLKGKTPPVYIGW